MLAGKNVFYQKKKIAYVDIILYSLKFMDSKQHYHIVQTIQIVELYIVQKIVS